MKSDLEKLDEALKENEELRKQYNDALERIGKSGEAESQSELVVKAAKEIGFDFTMVELEKRLAEKETLSHEDMEFIAGGHTDACIADYSCYTIYHHDGPAEPGHACWSNYDCLETLENSLAPQPGTNCAPDARFVWPGCTNNGITVTFNI